MVETNKRKVKCAKIHSVQTVKCFSLYKCIVVNMLHSSFTLLTIRCRYNHTTVLVMHKPLEGESERDR